MPFAGTMMAKLVSADHLHTVVAVETRTTFRRKRHAALPVVMQLEISVTYQRSKALAEVSSYSGFTTQTHGDVNSLFTEGAEATPIDSALK